MSQRRYEPISNVWPHKFHNIFTLFFRSLSIPHTPVALGDTLGNILKWAENVSTCFWIMLNSWISSTYIYAIWTIKVLDSFLGTTDIRTWDVLLSLAAIKRNHRNGSVPKIPLSKISKQVYLPDFTVLFSNDLNWIIHCTTVLWKIFAFLKFLHQEVVERRPSARFASCPYRKYFVLPRSRALTNVCEEWKQEILKQWSLWMFDRKYCQGKFRRLKCIKPQRTNCRRLLPRGSNPIQTHRMTRN